MAISFVEGNFRLQRLSPTADCFLRYITIIDGITCTLELNATTAKNPQWQAFLDLVGKLTEIKQPSEQSLDSAEVRP